MLALTLLISLLLANAATFVAMDLLRPAVSLTPPVFLTSWCAAMLVVRRLRWHAPAACPPRSTTVMIVLALMLLLAPRASFPFEPVLNREVVTRMDDFARLHELVAMTASPNYPLRSPINPDHSFSFYYAALFPVTVLHSLLPGLTLKAALFWASVLYYVLILLSARTIIVRAFPSPSQVIAMMAMVTLFGGFGWIANLVLHGTLRGPDYALSVWWQSLALAASKQVFSIHASMLWAVHHAAALAAVVCAWSVVRWTAPGAHKWAIVGGLLLSALFSSPFVVAPAAAMMLVHARTIARRIIRHWPVALGLVACLVPMRLWVGKPQGVWFRVALPPRSWGLGIPGDALVNLGLHVTAVPIVELALFPLIALWLWPRMTRVERWYVAVAWLFFVATFFVEFAAGNPFAMRGMLVPSLVFVTVAIRRLPGRANRTPALAGVLLIALASVGTVLHAIEMLPASYFLSPAPPVFTRIAKDAAIGTIAPSADHEQRMRQYHAERPMRPPVPLDAMMGWERELTGPR